MSNLNQSFDSWQQWEEALDDCATEHNESIAVSLDGVNNHIKGSERYFSQWEEVISLLGELDLDELLFIYYKKQTPQRFANYDKYYVLCVFVGEAETHSAVKQELIYRKGNMSLLQRMSLPVEILAAK